MIYLSVICILSFVPFVLDKTRPSETHARRVQNMHGVCMRFRLSRVCTKSFPKSTRDDVASFDSIEPTTSLQYDCLMGQYHRFHSTGLSNGCQETFRARRQNSTSVRRRRRRRRVWSTRIQIEISGFDFFGILSS